MADVASSVELRWRSDEHQAALNVRGVWHSDPKVSSQHGAGAQVAAPLGPLGDRGRPQLILAPTVERTRFGEP